MKKIGLSVATLVIISVTAPPASAFILKWADDAGEVEVHAPFMRKRILKGKYVDA